MNAEDINPDLSNPFNKSQGLPLQPPAPPDTPQQTPPQPGLAQDTIDRALEAQGPLLAARSEGQGLDNDLKRQQLIKIQRNRDGSRLRYRSKIGMENAGTQAKGMEKFKQIDMANNKPDWAKRIGSEEWKAESNARNKADGVNRIAERRAGSKAVVDAIKARRAARERTAGQSFVRNEAASDMRGAIHRGARPMIDYPKTGHIRDLQNEAYTQPDGLSVVRQRLLDRAYRGSERSVARRTPVSPIRQLAMRRKANPLLRG